MEQYVLEIYPPDSPSESLIRFSSKTPFLAINVNDFINPRMWESSYSGSKLLKVVNIEHLIWIKGGVTKHKLCVFTTEIDDTSDTRQK